MSDNKSRNPERIQADIIRTLYRLGVITYDELDRVIDELQIRLFEREGYVTRRGTVTTVIKKE